MDRCLKSGSLHLCLIPPTPSGLAAIMEAILSQLRPHMSSVRRPGTYDKVYNSECVLSFDTPFSPGGLFVSLSNWQGVGFAFLESHSARTESKLYLHLKKTKVPNPEDPQASAPESIDDLLQASKEENKYTVTEELAVILAGPGGVVSSAPFPHDDLPMAIADAAQAVATHMVRS